MSMMQTHPPIIILAGPTASGKSALALDIAQMLPAVIINCDSKQIYREIPIITAQPSADEQAITSHRLYGCISASEHCSVADWIALAKDEISAVHARGKVPFLVGGTGMYIQALTQGISSIPTISPTVRSMAREMLACMGNEAFHEYLTQRDPVMARRLAKGDSQRMVRALEVIEQTGVSLSQWQQVAPQKIYNEHQIITFFFSPEREKTYQNCEKRFHLMLDRGVIEEIKALQSMNLEPTVPAMKAHGVPELLAYLNGQMTLEQASAQAILNTRHYIKRQWTWYRHQMPDAIRLDADHYKTARQQVIEKIQKI